MYYLAAGVGSTSFYSLARHFRQLCRSRIIHGGGGGGGGDENHDKMHRDHRASNDLLDRIKVKVVNDMYTLLVTLVRLEREFDNVNINSSTT